MDAELFPERGRILLIEDEEAHADIIERSFARDGTYQLTRASTIAEGASFLEGSPFDLVLADWRLPDGEAFDLLTASRRLPLLIMTSRGDEKIAVRAMRAGALDYVVKSESSMLDMVHIAERAIRQWKSAIAGELREERTRELEVRNREIERANRMKSEFLANMSHELRTPLHTVIGFSELLGEEMKGPLNVDQKRFVNHIRKDALHLLALINEILDLSRIEAGKLILSRETLDLNAVLDDATSSIRPQCGTKSIRIEADIPLSILIDGDRVRVRQIFYNLLSNAVKFTPDGGCIQIAVCCAGGVAEISVSDSGIGIPPEEHQSIFDKFHQIVPATSGMREGTGLGLPITKRLVEEHGGRIWLASEPGKGSCFTFTLPLGRTTQESLVSESIVSLARVLAVQSASLAAPVDVVEAARAEEGLL
jgi:signal transduction histidine kinase